MRLTDPAPVTVIEPPIADDQPDIVSFTGQRGERLHIRRVNYNVMRVSVYPNGEPRNPRTWMIQNREQPVPREGNLRDSLQFSGDWDTSLMQPDADHFVYSVGEIKVRIDPRTFQLQWLGEQDRVFAADIERGAYTYDRASKSIMHTMQRREGEHYYGFGEVAGPLDKAGMRIRMSPVDALGYNAETTDPLYKHFPFYITFIPEHHIFYGLLYDNFSPTTFDMGKEIDYTRRSRTRSYQAEDGDLDYYLIYGGDEMNIVIWMLSLLVGKAALPPRWSLGYLGSTMRYTEAPDAQDQLAQFAALCREHDIPCDMFHLSSGYTTDAEGRRNVFTWNRSRIPDPAGMFETFHKAGIKVAPNVKPHLLTTHPDYAEVARIGGFIKNAPDSPHPDAPAVSQFWSGGAGTTAAGSLIDFTSDAGYTWWKRKITETLLAYGADAIWNDNNEFQIDDSEAICNGFGHPINIGQMRPVQTLLMARASYEALQAFRPDEPPFVISRSGGIGIQRYAQTWSGDNESSWHSLKWNIPMGLGLSLSGQPNTGHDVGGFYGAAPDPELFIRWVQNGVFHPRFCIHSWNTDGTVNEPWMYPDALPYIREAIRLRYMLIPYLYDYLIIAAENLTPIIRPLTVASPYDSDSRMHSQSFDFMVGDFLLVASVFEPGARTRKVYLPAGSWWCDFYTGEWFQGGQTVTVDAPLEYVPLFARERAFIPTGKVMHSIGEQPDDLRRVFVFPPPDADRHSQSIYQEYKPANPALVSYRLDGYSDDATPMALSISTARKAQALPHPFSEIEFVFPPGETRPIIGGEPMEDLMLWGKPRRRVRIKI